MRGEWEDGHSNQIPTGCFWVVFLLPAQDIWDSFPFLQTGNIGEDLPMGIVLRHSSKSAKLGCVGSAWASVSIRRGGRCTVAIPQDPHIVYRALWKVSARRRVLLRRFL